MIARSAWNTSRPPARQIARARREVIVSGGAYGSPQVLLLSGLGPAEHLRETGVPVVRDMPAVGANLHDHFNTYLSWRCAKPYHAERSGEQLATQDHGGGDVWVVPHRPDVQQRHPCRTVHPVRSATGTTGFADQPAGMEHAGAEPRIAFVPHPFPGFTLRPGASAPGRTRGRCGWGRRIRWRRRSFRSTFCAPTTI